jgi:hypothetical protein
MTRVNFLALAGHLAMAGLSCILLTSSMLWQNVPWQLAAIQAGDWLIKLILIPWALRSGPNRMHT